MKILSLHRKSTVFACFAFSAIFTLAPVKAQNSVDWDGRVSVIKCEQIGGGMEFTLDINQKVPRSELRDLCSCIADETQQKGWELDALSKVASGQDINPITKAGAIGRFGKAVDYCSRGKFYVSSEAATQPSSLNTFTLRALGLLGGGPIGFFASPFVYELVGQNVIVWAIIGVVVGGPLWQLTIGVFGYLIMLLVAFVKPNK